MNISSNLRLLEQNTPIQHSKLAMVRFKKAQTFLCSNGCMAAKYHKFIGEGNRKAFKGFSNLLHKRKPFTKGFLLSVMTKRMTRREHSHFDIFKRYRPGELQDNTNFATIK
jgi:hypothetical protein